MSARNEVSCEEITGPEASLVISRLGRRARMDDLRGKVGYLMVSVKNPNFPARLVGAFCDLAESQFARGEVILFDTPYAATIAATEVRASVRDRKLSTLREVAREKRRFFEKTLAKRDTSLPIRSFDDVEREVDPILIREVRGAFQREGPFRRVVLDRAREVIPEEIPDEALPRFAEFLVREIPVLCHLYYHEGEESVVDVYPGEPFDLFWDIERGRYSDELPEISRRAGRSPGVICVDVRTERRRERKRSVAG